MIVIVREDERIISGLNKYGKLREIIDDGTGCHSDNLACIEVANGLGRVKKAVALSSSFGVYHCRHIGSFYRGVAVK